MLRARSYLDIQILDLAVQILDLEVQILDLDVQILDLEPRSWIWGPDPGVGIIIMDLLSKSRISY